MNTLRTAPAAPSPLLADMPVGVAGQLVRDRLVERLSVRFDQAVVTVCGGAGFGKSTALAQAVRHHALNPCGVDVWYTCGPADRDAARFAAGLVRCTGAQVVADPLRSVLAAIGAFAPLDVCLVLDDVHHLEAGTSAAELLGRLVRQLPATAHVVLAGRDLPEVPLARLRAAGRVTDVGEHELAFTAEEVAALAAGLGREPPREAVFGGWPALVRLALTAPPGAAAEFLREELVAELPTADRDVLVALAQLGTATPDDIGRVLDRPADPAALARRLPLVDALGDGRFRCHALWREVLERQPPRDDGGLRRRSVQVLLDAGRFAEAGACAIRGDDPQMLATAARELVARTLSVLPVGLASTWLDALPPDHRDLPEAVLLRAAVAQATDVADPRIDGWLDEAFAGFARRGDLPAAGVVLGLGVVAAQSRADVPRLADLVARAGSLPGAAGDGVLGVLLGGSRAVLAEMRGDPETAVRAFEAAPVGTVPGTLALSVHRFWLHCLLMAGRADDAVTLATRFLDTGGNDHSRRMSAVARWCAGDPTDRRDLFAYFAGPPVAATAEAPTAREAFLHHCVGAVVSSSGGLPGRGPAPDPDLLDNPRDCALATLAAAAQAVVAGDEAGAAALFGRHLARFPVADRLGERHLRRFLALGYVLAPPLRDHWDSAVLGPSHRRIREVARALLDARAGRVPGPVRPAAAFCALPLPWSVELACRLVAAGHPGGTELARWLADAAGPAVVDLLRRLAAHGGGAATGAAAVLATLPVRPAVTLDVRVLGPLEVDDGSGRDPVPRRARVRQVLAALVLHRTLTRDHLIDLFWPDLDLLDAQRNLRVTLTHLRRAVDPGRARGQAGYNLRVAGERVSLFDSPALQVDLWQFDRLVDDAAAAHGKGDAHRRGTLLERAVRLWRGPALPDLRSIPDLEPALERLRLRRLEAVLALGELRLVEGRWSDAAVHAADALAEAAFDERAHRLALAAALQGGDPAAVRAAARATVAALHELGVPAEPTTQVLLSAARHRLGARPMRVAG